MKKEKITIYADSDLIEKLQKKARQHGQTLNSIITIALWGFLEDLEAHRGTFQFPSQGQFPSVQPLSDVRIPR
uniref:hypothetical protein n=1 Tax=Ndongobacter massiliensis TaxID=1871025 RepID=UPI000931F962|nr:hypothetical protein [Ndongobacter massiliensis]